MALQQEMGLPPLHRGVLQRALQRLGATRAGTAFFATIMDPLDRVTHRLTGGRTTAGRALGALPVVMMTTIGARSGRPRTVPINVIPHGDDLALVGTNYGRGVVPAWAHNLRANPVATLTYRDQDHRVVAGEVGGSLYEDVFASAIRVYPGYADYRRRATNSIPVFILTASEEQ